MKFSESLDISQRDNLTCIVIDLEGILGDIRTLKETLEPEQGQTFRVVGRSRCLCNSIFISDPLFEVMNEREPVFKFREIRS